MKKIPMFAARRPGLLYGGALASALWLAGCSSGVLQNTQPAEEIARAAKPPGSVDTGWRVFQDKCAGCHGPAANGITGAGPDLLPRVRQMSALRFENLVLVRYDWSAPAAQAPIGKAPAPSQGSAVTMPAWRSDPRVSAHVADLYAYLWARAEGTQGTGRPGQ
jgi:mono/diheme cytochrome c family protein